MQKQVSPLAAAAIIAVVIIVIGGVLYWRAGGATGHPVKPADMAKNPKLRAEIGKEFRAEHGGGDASGRPPTPSPPQ